MTFNQLPDAQGLYRPEFEHDACGIGLYAHIKGLATHDIVTKGLKMLCQLDHRGGQGSDPMTGDGAGIMVQIPHEYFKRVCTEFTLPEKGRYGVGMVFFSSIKSHQRELEEKINALAAAEGQIVLGWRDVPSEIGKIGQKGKESCPVIRQVFIEAGGKAAADEAAFERKLYVIRKQAEIWAYEHARKFYFASLSARTIVYKGLLTPNQVDAFYTDLQQEDFVSAFALVHSRFSTNTFPSWERAHPNRYLIHNGEINTLTGNINWMKAREKQFISEAFGEDLKKITPILDTSGSDSAILDNAFEFFVLAGRKPAHAAMMLIPEPWSDNPHLPPEKRAFYEYHSTLMEPWDGPTAISFTDGRQIGAILDRNGLRPARYYVTKDDYLIFSSEVGVIDVDPENVLYKDRLSPGKMLLVDLEQGRIISDEEIKAEIAAEQPYAQWLNEKLVRVAPEEEITPPAVKDMLDRQKAFGYTYEDIHKYLLAVVKEGKDPLGSMGNDMPLAVLSDQPQSLFSYFKQLFAQVTNPPIDSLREQIVTSTVTYLGPEGNLLHPGQDDSCRIQLDSPVLLPDQMEKIKAQKLNGFKSRTLDCLFHHNLELALEDLFKRASAAIDEGVSLLILSDENMDKDRAAIPALLCASALHQELIRTGRRTKASIIIESGEVREVHHFAALIGYGADAVYPYLALASYQKAIDEGALDLDFTEAASKYTHAVTEGIVKVMSKMGISTVQSYRGAQIFEAVGISQQVIGKHFTGTASQIGGIDLHIIGEETLLRHKQGYNQDVDRTLESGSDFQWRKNGEHHAFNPKTIHTLQWACRKKDYTLYKQYSVLANEERLGFLRNLFTLDGKRKPIPIDHVETEDSIIRRFKTGAMSFGSLSGEAHETLAIAMNRLGGKSNSGEGGENPARFVPDENGDNRRSAIKQIASGRFGVNSHYLVNADELQIKMAQGAKPGEGGQLPGNKVYPWVAEVRGSTPGVGLISPPPHHDIYSIEDLSQLIHDLKNANSDARISVKLVSKAGVGTIAAGVAKGAADVIVISGYDGGTGASPKTSIKHTGLPWELGLAEAHQTLVMNGLRDRVVLETDGKLMTGKDVIMAALFGAEEFGFATAPLIVMGCIMMRACHLDTCPVGIATQNPLLRGKFSGDPEHVVNYMRFVAREVREILAELGFRTLEELVGRVDILSISDRAKNHWKAKYLDLSLLLYQPEGPRTFKIPQNHKIAESLDVQAILPAVKASIESGTRFEGSFPITNVNRVTGTITGSEISKRYGAAGLPEDTIKLSFTGSAGQSFGAFLPKGMTLLLTGDGNDYIGKGLSGGKIIVKAHACSSHVSAENVIAGNVAFYGASGGEAYINGMAGERFAVRNSGASLVAEGIGDHGCEYMTGGRVLILGETGKNFGAGMSGGIAYVLPEDPEAFKKLCNQEMVHLEPLAEEQDTEEVRQMLENHLKYTGSPKAEYILNNWDSFSEKTVKVIPKDYKKMTNLIDSHIQSGMTGEEAKMAAFMESSGQAKKSSSKQAVAQ